MTSRVPTRRWLFRDVPRTYVVLAWLAFGLSIIYLFFGDWFPFRHETAVRPQLSSSNKNNNDEPYTGSMIFVPSHGDRCLERMIDNRTGRMWDKAYINCDKLALTEHSSAGGMGIMRMRAIGKALLHESP
jgi:hypothetical protein